MIPIGCQPDRIRITHIRRFGILRIVHFIDTVTLMDTVRRIIVTIAVIIPIGTSIVDIIGVVGIHRFHDGLTKKAIYGLKTKTGVREVHAA